MQRPVRTNTFMHFLRESVPVTFCTARAKQDLVLNQAHHSNLHPVEAPSLSQEQRHSRVSTFF